MRPYIIERLAVAATVLALATASGSALAQTTARPPGTSPLEQYAPPINSGQPSAQQPQPTPDHDNSLSNRLSGSGGVVHPPSTDDPGVITPPDAGPHAMPVVPPPNAPGGKPNVVPK
jgi:hypothetical protein